MQGTITIAGSHDHGVHIEASLACEDILDKSYLKDIRFCGKEWLMERVERQVTKAGY